MSEVREVYSPARARQLRILLVAALLLGVILLMIAVALLLGGSDKAPYGLGLSIVATVVIATCGVTLRSLRDRGRAARVGTIAAGLVQVVLGVVLANSGVGILPSIVGILLILLALLPEATEDRTRE